MPTKNAEETDYESMTVPDLRDLAIKRDLDIPYDARKDEIISALEKHDKEQEKGNDKSKASKTDAAKSKKEKDDFPPDDEHTPPGLAGTIGIPQKPAGKEDTGLFQTGPDKKEWLTQAEAEEKGFYWKEQKKAKTEPA